MLGLRMRTCGTCPFCGLLCDGIIFPSQSTTAHADTLPNQNCERLTRGWLSSQPNSAWHLKPLRHGRIAEPRAAVSEAAQLIAQSLRPLFCGLGTDVAGMRQIVDYARHVGAILDHQHSDALQVNLKLLQHGGWISTTLSEIRFRADVIVLVGDGVLERFPRLLSLLADGTKSAPKIFWLGTDDLRFRSLALLLPELETISLKKSEWLSALSEIHARFSKRTDRDSGTPTEDANKNSLAALQTALAGSKYAAWIWSSADFLADGDDLILDSLLRVVTRLNDSTRSAVLPLAGSHGDVTAQQVCTWKTGFPLRQVLNKVEADYQPQRYRALNVLKKNDCDSAVYVSAFEPIEPPEEFWNVSGVKVIVGHPAQKSALRADYFFPTAIPGIDHDSHLFRGDGVAVVSLNAKRVALAPSVAEWFGNLLNEHVAQGGPSPSPSA